MKATVSRKDLTVALRELKRAGVGHRATLPVLGGVRIDVTDGVVTLAATDLETATVVTVRHATGHADGAALVEHKTLATIVGKLDGADVAITDDGDDGDRVALADGEATIDLPAMSLADYPPYPQPAPIGEAVTDLLPHFPTFARVASSDDHRPVLTAVMFGPDAVVATDSYRLAWIDRVSLIAEPALVPGRLLAAIAQAKPHAGDVTFGWAGPSAEADTTRRAPRVTFRGHTDRLSFEWTSRTVEGKYIDHRQLIPAEEYGTVTVDRRKLAKAADRIGALANPVTLTVDGGTLHMEAGGAKGKVAERIGGADGSWPTHVALNPQYLEDGCEAVGGAATVRIGMRDSMKPIVLRAEPTDDTTPSYLLMPVRL